MLLRSSCAVNIAGNGFWGKGRWVDVGEGEAGGGVAHGVRVGGNGANWFVMTGKTTKKYGIWFDGGGGKCHKNPSKGN